MKKRILAVLLCFCLLAGLLPTAAFAVGTDTGKAIQLGTGGISGYAAATNSYDYIYFGDWTATDSYTTSGPIKWRVLDTKTNMDNAIEGDGLFLLSDVLFGTGKNGGVYFQQVKHWVDSNSIYHQGNAPSNGDHSTCLLWNSWQGSDAQKWCNSFYDTYLTTQEQSAVLATTKSDGEFIANEGKSSSYRYTLAASENILNSDKVFFLSAEEANEKAYGFTEYTVEGWPYSADHARVAYYGNTNKLGSWWLRSPVSTNVASTVGSIPVNGFVFSSNPAGDKAARPAFNLDPSAILFISAAVGGKTSGTVGAGALVSVPDYSDNEWKLTLLDTKRSFSANVDGQTSVPAPAGDNVQITYSGAQTGDNEYVSVLLCDSSDNVLYYGNIAQNSESGTASLTIPADFEPGNYTLKVFSEQCNGDYKTDYASAFQNIELEITGLPQETTPSAVFTATGDNGGTLSNVDTSMKYSVDGGNTWNDITGEPMEITGVTTENGIKVYKPGNGTTTSDSEVQIIDVTQAEQPTGIDKADCTTAEQNNGQITGVNTTMEYRLSGNSDWTVVTENPVTGLTNGAYEVRVKASGTVLASTAVTVTIGEHTCVAQGNWQYDESGHWKLCACGAKVEETAHFGGTATCIASAVCEACGQPYGDKNPNNHTGTEAWITTETTHTKVYSCCQAVIETETAHTWENGKCSVCQYDCVHQGGTATCSQLAQCEICGSLYGSYDESNHKVADTWTQENGKHYHICEYGCNTHLDEADCSGGTATCTALAVCETCGQSYGVVNPDNHTGEAVWTQTATNHSSAYDCCGAVVIAEEAHEWNDGVCSECRYECQHSGGEATCEICNEKYGSLGAHKLSLTTKVEETCTTDGKEAYYTCEVCGKYFEDEAGNTEIANLDEWGIIPAAGHKAGTEWKSDGTNHWKECTVAGCGVIIDDSNAAHTFGDWITVSSPTCTDKGAQQRTCSECGFKETQDINPNGHIWEDNYTVDKAATCTEDGSRSIHCKKCDVVKDSEVISKTGHSYTDGKCTVCGAADPNYKPVDPKGSGKQNNDAGQGSNSPQMGDNSNIALWIFLMLVTGAALAGTAVYTHKKKAHVR